MTEPSQLDKTFQIILKYFMETGRAPHYTEIASEFDISLPAVSKHIKVLERAGLVKREKDGKLHKISYNKEAVRVAWSWIDQYREFWEKSFDSLSEFLDKKSKKGEK